MSKKGPYHMIPDMAYGSISLPKTRARKHARQTPLSERAKILGIPVDEMTSSVGLAVSALFEKMDDMARELERTKNSLHEMHQLVDVDCLAPIPNRRAFTRRLQWVIGMQNRYGHSSSILFFDLNGFKKINDTHGHAAGDAAILHIAELLQGAIRDTDFVARLGGDEFAVVLYHADALGAESRAKSITSHIASNPLNFNGHVITLSSSCGLYEIQKGDTAETALVRADAAMYADKKRHASKPFKMHAVQ